MGRVVAISVAEMWCTDKVAVVREGYANVCTTFDRDLPLVVPYEY